LVLLIAHGHHQPPFATLTARQGIPAAYATREEVEAGGLMSYGTDILDMFRQVTRWLALAIISATARELLMPPILPVDAIKAASTNAAKPQMPEHRCPCCGGPHDPH
jgi:hypothetical protein